MAFLDLQATWQGVTLAAGWKTIISVTAPSTPDQFVLVKALGIGFDGTAGDGIPLGIRFQTVNAASGTAVSQPTPWHNSSLHSGLSGAPRTALRLDFSEEPSGGTNTLYSNMLHPQGGALLQIPFDRFVIGPGVEVAFQVNLTSNQTAVDTNGYLHLEE